MIVDIIKTTNTSLENINASRKKHCTNADKNLISKEAIVKRKLANKNNKTFWIILSEKENRTARNVNNMTPNDKGSKVLDFLFL